MWNQNSFANASIASSFVCDEILNLTEYCKENLRNSVLSPDHILF